MSPSCGGQYACLPHRQNVYVPSSDAPAWRNWQTRWTQNPVIARSCGFEPLRRQNWLSGWALTTAEPVQGEGGLDACSRRLSELSVRCLTGLFYFAFPLRKNDRCLPLIAGLGMKGSSPLRRRPQKGRGESEQNQQAPLVGRDSIIAAEHRHTAGAPSGHSAPCNRIQRGRTPPGPPRLEVALLKAGAEAPERR